MRTHAHTPSLQSLVWALCFPLDAREASLFYPQSSHFQSQTTALHTWTSGNRSEVCLCPVRPEEWQTLLPPKPTENPITNMMVTKDTSLQNKSGTSCCLVKTLYGPNQSRASSFPAHKLHPLCLSPQIQDFSFLQLRF